MKENKRHHQVHSLCALQLHEELLLYLPLYTQCQQPGTALQLCGLLSMHSNKICQGWLLAVSVRGHQPLQVAQRALSTFLLSKEARLSQCSYLY